MNSGKVSKWKIKVNKYYSRKPHKGFVNYVPVGLILNVGGESVSDSNFETLVKTVTLSCVFQPVSSFHSFLLMLGGWTGLNSPFQPGWDPHCFLGMSFLFILSGTASPIVLYLPQSCHFSRKPSLALQMTLASLLWMPEASISWVTKCTEGVTHTSCIYSRGLPLQPCLCSESCLLARLPDLGNKDTGCPVKSESNFCMRQQSICCL